MKRPTSAQCLLVAGMALGGVDAQASPASAVASTGPCAVEALTPSTRYVAGIPSASAGRAHYKCNNAARLTIYLVKKNPWPLADLKLPGWSYTVPARSTWSGVYAGLEANCGAYGHGAEFRTEATLTFNGHSITDKGIWFRSC